MKRTSTLSLATAFLAGLLAGAPTGAPADDTEIYVGSDSQALTHGVRPNVLFILDTSGSMSSFVTGTGKDRLDNMKDALKQILNEANNINVGLMRFTDPGGPVLFPVSYIDEDAAVIEGGDQADINVRVSESADDAEELVGSATLPNPNLNSPRLEIVDTETFGAAEDPIDKQISNDEDDVEQWVSSGYLWNNSSIMEMTTTGTSSERILGLRFRNLDELPTDDPVGIPKGASIDRAYIEFTAYDDDSEETTLYIQAEDVDDADPFQTGTTSDVSDRVDIDNSGCPAGGGVKGTDACVEWVDMAPWTQGVKYRTPDLSAIMQELVCRGVTPATAACPDGVRTSPPGGWESDDVVFAIAGTGLRRARTADYGDGSSAATLHVEYADGGDSGEQLVGVRFQDVKIPQGVKITEAWIDFTAASPGAQKIAVKIWGEASDDALPFGDGSGGTAKISTRPKVGMLDGDPLELSIGVNVGDAPVPGLDEVFQSINASKPLSGDPERDLREIVQRIVGRTGWCGGNDMAFIIEKDSEHGPIDAYSWDGDPTRAPVLRVNYELETPAGAPLGPSEGCMVQTVSSQIVNAADDATQVGNDMYRTLDTLFLGGLSNADLTSGFRFQNVPIPQGAEILDARLEFTAGASDTGVTSLDFYGEDADDAGIYSSANKDITKRTTTTASASWSSVPAWTIGDSVNPETFPTMPNLKDLVQEIVCRGAPSSTVCPGSSGNWQSGNDMAFIVTGSGLRQAISFDDSPGESARLVVTLKGTAGAGTTVGSLTTVRERLKEIVDDLDHAGFTPIVDALYEAARYFRGEGVHYGASRGEGGSTVERNTRVSHAASYTGASVVYPAGCTDADLSDEACRDQVISGSAEYITPVTDLCGANYIILLTDGEANNNHSQSLIQQMADLTSCQSALSDSSSVATGEQCGVDLAEFLASEDQLDSLAGDQTVTTYTIGFNFSGQFLRDLALQSGGQFKTAANSAELASEIRAIFSDILDRTTSFAAPSLSVNAFNKLFHRKEVYFSLFKPSDRVRWDGNVKKYQICDQESCGDAALGEVLDADANRAIGDDERIRDTARSFWTSTADGSQVTVGGAGPLVNTYSTGARRVFTYTGSAAPSNEALTDASNAVDPDNTAITKGLLNGSDTSTASNFMSDDERAALIRWIGGQNVDNEDNDGDTNKNRYVFADPLHSSPVAVTVGTEDPANPDDKPVIKLFVGTNDGGLRMINAENGEEEWIFYPQDALLKQRELRTNPNGDHRYGLDDTPFVWLNDEDRDGIIEPTVDVDGDGTNEFVRVFIGMRRGGSHIYAVDVTPKRALNSTGDAERIDLVDPVLLWRIDGGTSDFPALAQTWSRAQLTTISEGTNSADESQPRTVLIFAGGYDEAQDTGFGSGGNGNAIYVADALSGEPILSVSDTGSGATVEVADMVFPIPSDLALLDSDANGSTDRLYVGDTGGQLWRVDVLPDLSNTRGYKVVVGKLAEVSDITSLPQDVNELDKRKFFYPPDVVQVNDSEFAAAGRYDLVAIASGNRANPLSTSVQDRLFAFRDVTTGFLSDTNGDGLADGYTTLKGALTGPPSRDGDLFDATQVDSFTEDDLSALRQADGWYISFPDDGEKALAPPIILAGKLFMTTYLPEGVPAGTCQPEEGAGRLYGLNVLNAAAVFNWDTVNNMAGSRTYQLGSGIPSGAVPIFQKKGVTLLIGSGGGATTIDPDIALPRNRTFWYQER